MKKKGFTLVELLAVIAILAILVIIALPNVIGMFRIAKKNSFMTELKNIVGVVEESWMNDSLFKTSKQVSYSRSGGRNCGSSLDLSGRTELDYYVEVNKHGKITKFYATDGTYQFTSTSEGLQKTDITEVQVVGELDPSEIIKVTCNGISIGGNQISTITDKSGNGNNATNYGGEYNSEDGTYTTNGKTSYANLGLTKHDFGNSATVVLRAKINSLHSGTNSIFNNFEGAGLGFEAESSKKYFFQVYVNGAYRRAYIPTGVEIDKMMTVVGTYDGNDVKVYKDGELVGTTHSVGVIKVSPFPFLLGTNPGSATNMNSNVHYSYTNITATDALIYDRTLSDEEIKTYFSGEIKNYSSNKLLVSYKF